MSVAKVDEGTCRPSLPEYNRHKLVCIMDPHLELDGQAPLEALSSEFQTLTST